MYIDGIESWKIVTSSDHSLNFAIFVGCIYGLIEDNNEISNNKLWPPKLWSNELTEPSTVLLKEQWNKWFDSMVKDRGEKVISKQQFDYENPMFNPPEFVNFPYNELKKCLRNAWEPFLDWWEMPGGGKNALSHFEDWGSNSIYRYIDEFENIAGRKVKPFSLYIDMIYTGTTQSLEVNDEYIVMAPIKPVYFNRKWWMHKLEQIG